MVKKQAWEVTLLSIRIYSYIDLLFLFALDCIVIMLLDSIERTHVLQNASMSCGQASKVSLLVSDQRQSLHREQP